MTQLTNMELTAGPLHRARVSVAEVAGTRRHLPALERLKVTDHMHMGTSDGRFVPEAACERQQMAALRNAACSGTCISLAFALTDR